MALAELGSHDATLAVDGIAASELAATFGTPLYVFSAAALARRVARVRAAFGSRCEVLWSIKANPNLAVTTTLRAAGAGAEIASLGELEVALAAGYRARELRFAGPGKTDAELTRALAAGVGTFHVESLDELQCIAELASARGEVADVALRVNLPDQLAGARMRMGGQRSRFGIDAEQVPAAARLARDHAALRLRGLHVYGGTQCFDADAFVGHARALCDNAATWERDLDVRFDELDLGGGFGVPVYAGDPLFDLDRAARGLQALMAEHDRDGRRWFVELGRYLAAPAGVFLARVVRTHRSGGHRYAVLDGGMHHAAAAAGLGTILRRPPLLVAAEHLDAVEREPITVGGPLCTPADQFADDLPLPPVANGDLLAILNAGAYGLTFSPHSFLSPPRPAEVLVEHGTPRLVRRRGEPGDALRDQLR